MNKKNILILIATIVVAAVVFSFAAANADACKHEHTSNWWTVLDDCHKRIIKCDDCKTTIYDDSKFDPHVFVDGVCKCGKTDPNYQPLNIDLDIEEPEEEPEEEPLIQPEGKWYEMYYELGISYFEKTDSCEHYYRWLNDDDEYETAQTFAGIMEIKLGRELTEREKKLFNATRKVYFPNACDW